MSLLDTARQIAQDAEGQLAEAKTEAEVFQIKARYLGRKGALTALLKQIPALEPADRRTTGAGINAAKRQVEAALAARLESVRVAALSAAGDAPADLTLPGRSLWRGHLHPVTRAWSRITDIFSSMGFDIVDGPEVETDWHCFEALNIPAGHPAREMQDTFYVQDSVVLRTHTSPVQIRTMLVEDPPIRMICPGVVYRRDNDHTHTPMFHQVEGLVVDESTTMADLKGTLAEFARAFFGADTRVRFRSSYFPFTEPSAEVDVSCPFCAGSGCRVCSRTGWLEVLGSGMVDPEVFAAVERATGRGAYDPDRIQGYAFGMGIDRLAMLSYGIDDLRILFENDLRMLEQF